MTTLNLNMHTKDLAGSSRGLRVTASPICSSSSTLLLAWRAASLQQCGAEEFPPKFFLSDHTILAPSLLTHLSHDTQACTFTQHTHLLTQTHFTILPLV